MNFKVHCAMKYLLKNFKDVKDIYPYVWRYDRVRSFNQRIPDFPLLEVAECWNIRIDVVPGSRDTDDGMYIPWQNKIILCSSEEIVFFNALSHAAIEKLYDDMCFSTHETELVAELSAQVLYRLEGTRKYTCFGNTYGIIERCASMLSLPVVSAVRKFLPHAEQVVTLILSERR